MGTFASKATHTRFNAASQPTSNIFTKRIALPESKRKREGEKTQRERERERKRERDEVYTYQQLERSLQ